MVVALLLLLPEAEQLVLPAAPPAGGGGSYFSGVVAGILLVLFVAKELRTYFRGKRRAAREDGDPTPEEAVVTHPGLVAASAREGATQDARLDALEAAFNGLREEVQRDIERLRETQRTQWGKIDAIAKDLAMLSKEVAALPVRTELQAMEQRLATIISQASAATNARLNEHHCHFGEDGPTR